MKKVKQWISLLLVVIILTGMFPAGASVSGDVPEIDDLPVIEVPQNPNAPEVFPGKPEDTAEQLALTEDVSGTCGENLTWTLTTDGTLTISGTGEMEDYNWGFSPWWSYKDSLLHVVIEDGVTSVGEYAFASCFYLKSITFGENVTSIGRVAFNCCYDLADVTFPEALETIGNQAFFLCESLESITIPASVTSLGNYVFDYCTNLVEIKVDSNNEYYCSVDGVLFTKDMEKLLEYPARKAGDSYVIPSGVIFIESFAFRACTNLVDVTVSSGVTNIASDAFDDCTNLVEIKVDSNNEYYCSVDGILFSKDMERFCKYPAGKAGDSYTIPDSVTYISGYAFADCVNLKNITVLNSAIDFAWDAFESCTSLESVELPEGITTIVRYMFGNCPNLVDVTIPDSVTVIEDYAFYCCESLPGITIPDGVESIGRHAFDACDSLDEITVKEGNQYYSSVDGVLFDKDQATLIQYPIGKAASSYTIPDGVESIGEYAFSGNDLASITIPVSVTSISYGAFGYKDYNSVLKVVRYAGSEEQWNAIAIEGANGLLTSATILFLADIGDTIASGTCGDDLDWVLAVDGTLTITGTGDMDDFDYYNEWNGTGGAPWVEHRALISRVVIDDGVTSIGEYGFSSCEALGEITIPNSVTAIGEGAFYQCTSLPSIQLPAGVTSIADEIFYNCTSLAEIAFLGEITYIGDLAFYSCRSLESFVIPSSVTFVGSHVFYNCAGLAEITVESGNPGYCSVDGILFTKDMTTLMKYPGRKAGTTYVIPDTVTALDSGAFSSCASLKNITLPDSVTWMGGSVFEGCSSLESIVIPDGVTSIGFNAFMGCYNLVSVTIPNSVTNIATQAFWGCSSLESINIPASVTNIAYSAFCGCSSLESIVIPDGITKLDMQLFSGCSSLESIVIPASVTSIGDRAFRSCTSLKTVYYAGTEAQWGAITVGSDNDGLNGVNIIYNWDQNAGPVVTGSVDPATGKPMLTWGKYPGAEKYEVYRSTSKNGTYTRTYTTTGTTYKNTSAVPGTTYYYKVRAVAGESYSEFSEIVSITCPSLAPVITVTVNADSGKPTVTWDAVDGATKYEVYRSTSKDGSYVKALTTTGTKYTNTGAVPGTTYYYKVRVIIGTSSYDSAIGSATCDCARPVASVALNANGKPRVTWNAVTGAAKYEVYRSTSKNGTYTKTFTTSGTAYTNTSAVAGTTYYYKVVAICGTNTAGNSAYSEIVSITCPSLAPVITVSVNEVSGKPTITWEAVQGATKYEVYRSTSKDGSYIKALTTTGTKYTNTSAVAGTTYYYKVRAIIGGSSYDSAIGSATCKLARPVVTITLNSGGKPRLTWNAVTGATKYEVYRSTSKNGTYTKTFTTTGTAYTNTSAVAGTTYYYKVIAICGASTAGNSAYSEIVSITCPSLAPVITVTVNEDSGKPMVTWEAVNGATKYEVYRSTSKNGSYVKALTTTGTKYTNTSAVAGTTYYYKVRAIVGTSSYESVIGSATCKLARPVVTITLNSSGKPRLTWDAVDGAVKYEVYRSTSLNGTYTKTFTTTGTSYNNTSAVSGTKYYYKVVAICETTAGNSAYSVVKSITAE